MPETTASTEAIPALEQIRSTWATLSSTSITPGNRDRKRRANVGLSSMAANLASGLSRARMCSVTEVVRRHALAEIHERAGERARTLGEGADHERRRDELAKVGHGHAADADIGTSG